MHNDGELKFKIVVIGVSLGGLHALRVILSALPTSFPLPIIIVQHQIDRKGDTFLVDRLKSYCALPIYEAEDEMALKNGHVFVAPAGYHLLVTKTKLRLSEEAPLNYSRPSIDVMFESAAQAYHQGVVAVLLTGMNADGAKGLASIHKKGGFAIIQDPATAESPVMPNAAIKLKSADLILPLREIGPFLANL